MNQENYGKLNQRMEDDELTIDLGELFGVLLSKAHIIILAAILMALVAFVGTKLLITPKYTSVTKMYVLAKDDGSTGTTSNYSEHDSWKHADKGLYGISKKSSDIGKR